MTGSWASSRLWCHLQSAPCNRRTGLGVTTMPGPTRWRDLKRRRWRVRDAKDFDEFYAASVRWLTSQLYAMTGDRAEAEDAVQEAFARAWQRWGRVSGYADPEAWVRTVACRISISSWRKATNRSLAQRRHGARRGSSRAEPGLRRDSHRQAEAGCRSACAPGSRRPDLDADPGCCQSAWPGPAVPAHTDQCPPGNHHPGVTVAAVAVVPDRSLPDLVWRG
jgi:Sigma-70 region 2